MFGLFLLNSFIVIIAVLIHYEFLFRITMIVPKFRVRHRFIIIISVFSALIAHVIEIWLFALAYYYMNKAEGWGHLQGNFDGSLMDCTYFSFTTYTTLGFGDIEPSGNLRYLTGIESLTGLVLITWTASFLFFEMQRYWDNR
ncbi:MAG: ion channel [Gammaproteobacteria bacterium]|nr:ion channel [Gammaproteobacteria bacterium]